MRRDTHNDTRITLKHNREFYVMKRIMDMSIPGFVTIPGPYMLTPPLYAIRVDEHDIGSWYLFKVINLKNAVKTLDTIINEGYTGKNIVRTLVGNKSGFSQLKNRNGSYNGKCWEVHATIGSKIINNIVQASTVCNLMDDPQLKSYVERMSDIPGICSSYSSMPTFEVAVSLAFCAKWAFKQESLLTRTGGDKTLAAAVNDISSFEGFITYMPHLVRGAILNPATGAKLNIMPISDYAYSLYSPFAFSAADTEAEQKRLYLRSCSRRQDNTEYPKKPNLKHAILKYNDILHRLVTAILIPDSRSFNFDIVSEYESQKSSTLAQLTNFELPGNLIMKHAAVVVKILEQTDETGLFSCPTLEDIVQTDITPDDPILNPTTTQLPENSCIEKLVYGPYRSDIHYNLVDPDETMFSQEIREHDTWQPGDRPGNDF